ncbi:leucine-rich repeat-containing protein 20 isoform X3 [Latimeria chalumnae]|uniref:leucine-rich repeat-containing protein 20 isoform X3 n=1 Tax=Latimeria chalumnae TaxID=7897 RepID=UPI0003C120CA|nr:PREDICTED: leucine-rich repeat-containing protein 20 isoform X4 [Latimeria chalumnae]|eukprot:XP_005991415.1 PREDICTED: leucine-rich repeat-containing protein 20 isoform X4 [Latimeria chalumnae]
MLKIMGEAVAHVARKANETVENGKDCLDLADCKLMNFPVGIYKVLRNVTEKIYVITLANNQMKSITSKFITTFSQLRELNLEGNYLCQLPEEVQTLVYLTSINLARNKFTEFPKPLIGVKALETINLEQNEITGKGRRADPAYRQKPGREDETRDRVQTD